MGEKNDHYLIVVNSFEKELIVQKYPMKIGSLFEMTEKVHRDFWLSRIAHLFTLQIMCPFGFQCDSENIHYELKENT